MGINTDAVQRLYVAYFNRPADPAGLTAFEALLSSTVAATQAELEAIATNFRTSQEYIDLYAGMSNAAIVNAMYNNLFGRDCESVTILNTWVNWIADGTYTFEQLALQLTYSAQGTDATVIANKLAASTAFTTAIDTVDEYIGYSGNTAAASARTWLATVTDVTSTLTTATAAVDTTIAAIVTGTTAAAGTTYTLTTSLDSIVGGAGTDTIDGSQNANGTDTFSASDAINGGLGTDTLTVTIKAAAAIAPALLKDVEIVNVTSTANSSGINFAGATGVTNINLAGSSATAFATGISSTSIALGVKNTSSSGTFTFTDAALSGSADSVSLAIENVSSGTVTVQPTGGATTNGVETIAITSSGSGANTLTALGDGAGTSWTAITVAGTQGIDLGTALPTTVTTLTSTATGTTGVTAIMGAGATTVTGGEGNDSFSFVTTVGNVSTDGGAGDDTFTFDATGTLTSGDTVTGGEGTDDKIVSTSAQITLIGSTLTKVTGVEHLEISDATAGAINATLIGTGINQVTFANSVGNTGTLTVNAGATTLNLKGAVNTTALNVTANGSATTDALTIVTDTIDQIGGNAITGTGVETLNIGMTKIAQTVGTITLNGSSAVATTLNLTGGFSLTVAGGSKLEASTINASTMTVGSTSTGVVMTTAATTNTAQTITGSAGLDTLYGSSGADSITGGTGNDAITAGAGNDTILGDAGNDTLTFGDSLASGDSINGGDGNDTISLTATSVTALNALGLSAVTTLNDRISNVEKLSFSNDFGASFDLARADNISDVTLAVASAGAYTISSFAATNNLQLNAATNDINVTLGDGSGSSDVFNLKLQNAATTDFGTVTIGTTASSGQIETVNITNTEGSTANSTVRVHTVALDSAAGLMTLNLSGTESLTSTVSSESLATVNASGLTEGAANITATASLVNMTVTGSDQDDTFSTGAGADSVSGGVGDDNLTGGSSNDTLNGGSGNDTIANGVGVDSLVGGDGTDTITAAALGTDGGTAASRGTVINLGTTSVSAATINGHVGFSVDSTTLSADLSAAASNTAVLLGTNTTVGSRVDVLSGFENVTGSTGKDYIVGTSAANTITGGAGADVMTGGSGADTFVQATGDSIAASATSCTATFTATDTITFGSGVDVITDFVGGTDTLDVTTAGAAVTALGAASDLASSASTYFLSGAYVAATGVFTIAADGTGADTLIIDNNDATGTIIDGNVSVVILVGVDSDTLVAGSFI